MIQPPARPLFTKIVLAVDGSTHSQRASALARDVASRYGAEVVIVHVLEPGLVLAGMTGMPAAVLPPEDTGVAQALIDAVSAEFRKHGITSSARLCDNQEGVAREILKVAGSEGCDLIVIGSRGASGLGELLMGSVAHRVTQMAKCPVLIAH